MQCQEENSCNSVYIFIYCTITSAVLQMKKNNPQKGDSAVLE